MTTDPTGDQPRWTVDDEAPPDRPTLILDVSSNDPLFFQWDHRSEIAESEWAALVAAVRDAAEVPALRARLAEVEAELADALDPEEEPYSSTRILEARLEAAEAAAALAREEIRRHPFQTRPRVLPLTRDLLDLLDPPPGAAEAIARARGDQP